MIPPILVALVFDEPHLVFLRAFAVTFTFGAILWIFFEKQSRYENKRRFLNNHSSISLLALSEQSHLLMKKGLGLAQQMDYLNLFPGLPLLEPPLSRA